MYCDNLLSISSSIWKRPSPNLLSTNIWLGICFNSVLWDEVPYAGSVSWPEVMFHILWKTKDWLLGIWIHYVQDVWSSGNSSGEKRDHRMIAYAELERTHQGHQVLPLALCRTLQESHPVPENVVKHFTNSDTPTTVHQYAWQLGRALGTLATQYHTGVKKSAWVSWEYLKENYFPSLYSLSSSLRISDSWEEQNEQEQRTELSLQVITVGALGIRARLEHHGIWKIFSTASLPGSLLTTSDRNCIWSWSALSFE